MLNKKLLISTISTFIFLLAFISYVSAGTLTISPSRVQVRGTINIVIDYPNYGKYVYFYNSDNKIVLTLELGCGEGGCFGEREFWYTLRESIFPPGVYNISIYSITDNKWIMQSFEVVGEIIVCSDGTRLWDCSITKPKYCNPNGNLVDSCQACGCPSGNDRDCQSDGTCVLPSNCGDGTLLGTCSSTKPKYCDDNGFLVNNCQTCDCPEGQTCQSDGTCVFPSNCGDGTCSLDENCNTCSQDCRCSLGYKCQADGSCKIFYAFPVGANTKSMSLYSDKEVFLVSDRDWKNVLPFVSVTTWTQGNEIKKYPILIYHGEEETISLQGIEFTITTSYGTYDRISETSWWECANFDVKKIIPTRVNVKEERVSLGEKIHLTITLENCDRTWGWSNYYLYVRVEQDSYLFSKYGIEKAEFFNPGEKKSIDVELTLEQLKSSFDVDSIIYFMQQYSPSKVTIIGETPQDVDDLLITSQDFGAGLTQENIQRVNTKDYLYYWDSFDTLVYVEDNYELALLASTYASLINAPLIIKGTERDSSDVFFGRNIICVGSVSPAGNYCSEEYTLEQLQQKYKSKTNTDKIILINPDDWIPPQVSSTLSTDKSSSRIYNLYTKTSLVAPILASGKQELILSTHETDYQEIDNFVKQKINQFNPGYLTIMSGDIIPYKLIGRRAIRLNLANSYWALDPSHYADITGDNLPDVAIGRIAGFTSSDVSSYIARDLFYNTFQKTNNMKFMASSFRGLLKRYTDRVSWSFKEVGYNAVASTTDEESFDFSPTEWENQDLIFYADHAAPSEAGIGSMEIPELKNSLVMILGCSTASTFEGDSFWAWTIRRGAIGFVGATGVTFWNVNQIEFLSAIYYDNIPSIGEAFKITYDDSITQRMVTLIGDPTLDIKPEKKLREALSVIELFLCVKKGNYCGLGILLKCCPGSVCKKLECKNAYLTDTQCGIDTDTPTDCTKKTINYCSGAKIMNKNKECRDGKCKWRSDESGTLIEDCALRAPKDLVCNIWKTKVKGLYYKCDSGNCAKKIFRDTVEKCSHGCSESGGAHCMTAEEACKQNRELCLRDRACCSNICRQVRCRATACKENGELCVRDRACCSNNCRRLRCRT